MVCYDDDDDDDDGQGAGVGERRSRRVLLLPLLAMPMEPNKQANGCGGSGGLLGEERCKDKVLVSSVVVDGCVVASLQQAMTKAYNIALLVE